MSTPDSSTSRSRILLRASAASFVRSTIRARQWLRQAIWLWPLVAALVLGLVGFFVRQAMEKSIRDDIASELSILRDAEVAALRFWMKTKETLAASLASDPTAAKHANRLIEMAREPGMTQATLLASKELADLRAELGPILKQYGHTDFLVAGNDLVFAAGMKNELILQPAPEADRLIITKYVFHGKRSVTPPRPSIVLLPDHLGKIRAGVPTMFAWAPLLDSAGVITGALGVRIRPQDEFSHILSIGRSGKSGETYAFRKDGLMVSMSRFEDDMRALGILRADEESTLTISVRDPGADITMGNRPTLPPGKMPLTRAVESAIQGETGFDAAGYRDYRGVTVVGAWTWLEEYQLGIVTEQDLAEALAPVQLLKWFFWGLMGLLGLAALGIFGVALFAARLDRQARQASLEVKRLGQYALDQKIGEGAMGVVYRAHHAMLHRPTAVKFLDEQKTNEQSIARFEREVQLTSRLSHPNTVTIFDYGRTPEGVFYYAMELLDGTTLESLITKSGPVPFQRAIWFLRQICGSLAEAHEAGLIHRDIKPANIMVCKVGGVYDFIKVLDFGLAKAVDSEKQARLTAAGAIAGTPLYLAPEAIQDPDKVDAKADIYAVGAVAYFLLTGKPVFEAKSVMEILQMHMKAEPSPPSKYAPSSLPAELESLVLSALAKSPGQRPASTREMLELLDDWSIQYPWSQSAARGTESSNFSRTVVERDLAIDETTFITDTDVR